MEITDVFGAQAGFTKSDFGFRKLFSKPLGQFTKSPGRFSKFLGAGLIHPLASLLNFLGPVY